MSEDKRAPYYLSRMRARIRKLNSLDSLLSRALWESAALLGVGFVLVISNAILSGNWVVFFIGLTVMLSAAGWHEIRMRQSRRIMRSVQEEADHDEEEMRANGLLPRARGEN